MQRLGDTISHLKAARMQPAVGTVAASRLAPLPPAGSNPGELNGWCYVPDGSDPMPLVVVLHGCTQSANDYDHGSGWSMLAERHGFAVLFPEQRRANNPNLCFNWFSPADVRRGSGEVQSIREMVGAMIERHPIDPARVYVTGLSAGGAMTAALLACYPEVFAGGAIIAGLPYGAAGNMTDAFARMGGRGHVTAARYAGYVRDAADHVGRWPTVSIWHGTADGTVSPNNADAMLEQWRILIGCAEAPDGEDIVDGVTHRRWLDGDGRVCLEDYRVSGMGHGTPIATAGDDACGRAMPYMLDVGVSSTWHSAVRWGLAVPGEVAQRVKPRRTAVDTATPISPIASVAATPTSIGIQATIEAALRQAGLMR